MFCLQVYGSLVEENIMYQHLKKICRENVCRIKVLRTNREIRAKYPLHPQKIASSYTRNVSVFFGGSECVNAAILSKELFVCADKHQGLLLYQLEYEQARNQGRRSPPRNIFFPLENVLDIV